MAKDAPEEREHANSTQRRESQSELPAHSIFSPASVENDARALLLSDAQESPAGWVNKNLISPLLNSAIVDSHNAFSSSVNDVANVAGFGKNELGQKQEIFADWKNFEQSPAQLLSKEWFAQSMAGAVGAIVPYGLAALGTGVVANKLGALATVGSAGAKLLGAKSFHLIAGATIYDGMRKPHEGETRIGNALGGATGFSIFEAGNQFSKGFLKGGVGLVGGRVITGAIGGAGQLTASNLWSKGELASSDQYTQAILTGATLNTVLPKVHQEISGAFSHPAVIGKNNVTGRGGSENLRSAVAGSESMSFDATRFDATRIEPTAGPELSSILTKLEPIKTEKAGDRRSAALPGSSIEAYPTQRPARVAPENVNWSAVMPTAKINLLNGLEKQAAIDRAKFFNALITDTEAGVAEAAAKALPKLAPADRFDAWKQVAESDNWDVNDQTINLMSSLPKERLPEAFDLIFANAETHLHQNGTRVLLGRIREESSPNMQLVSLIRSPELIGEPALRQTLWNKAYEHQEGRLPAISAIDALPPHTQVSIWNKAWENATKAENRSGAEEIQLLLAQAKSFPQSEIGSVWEKIVASDRHMTPSEVLPIFNRLPETGNARLTAWRQLLDNISSSGSRKSDRGLLSAIQQLPEGQRGQAWNEALNSLKLTEGSVREFANTIEHIEPEKRLGAFQQIIENGNKIRLQPWTWNLRSLPAEDIPKILETMGKITDEIERKDMVMSLDLGLHAESPAIQEKVARSVFANVMADPTLSEGRILRKWWTQLAEQVDESGRSSPSVRRRLAGELPVEGLAQILVPGKKDLAATLARKHPNAVRELAGSDRSFFGDDNGGNPEFTRAVAAWVENGSLEKTVAQILDNKLFQHNTHGLADLAKQIAAESTVHDSRTQTSSSRADVLNMLLAKTKNAKSEAEGQELGAVIEIAAGIGRYDRGAFEKSFAEPLHQTLSSNDLSYSKRLDLARQIAMLQRDGASGALELRIPDLRMPKVEISSSEQARLRSNAEKALHDSNPETLQALLGDGELGKIFPAVLGNANEGGIVGRIQHEGHKFTVDEHTQQQLARIQEDPRFAQLREKEQTDLLWASLFHDSGKRPGVTDPGHEWVSANLSWGVLQSLGYPPERISRIATLISRHSELSYWPENPPTKALENKNTARDLAVFYRNPSAPLQLSILNTADIKALDGTASKFTPEVERELQHAREVMVATQAEMAKPIPLLLTPLPRKFGFFTLPEQFQVLAHAAPDLGGFLQNKASIQSHRSNLSTSVFTREHQIPYQSSDAVALLTTTPERISTAGPTNLGTGRIVDWQGHIDLSFDKSHNKSFWQSGYESWLQKSTSSTGPKTLEQLFGDTTKFDNLADLHKNGSADLIKAQEKLVETITRDSNGKPLTDHNEVKANNPHVDGVGILTKRRDVVMQDMDTSTFTEMLDGMKKPDWLLAPNQVSKNAFVIPKSVWKPAQEFGLPLVVLDR